MFPALMLSIPPWFCGVLPSSSPPSAPIVCLSCHLLFHAMYHVASTSVLSLSSQHARLSSPSPALLPHAPSSSLGFQHAPTAACFTGSSASLSLCVCVNLCVCASAPPWARVVVAVWMCAMLHMMVLRNLRLSSIPKNEAAFAGKARSIAGAAPLYRAAMPSLAKSSDACATMPLPT